MGIQELKDRMRIIINYIHFHLKSFVPKHFVVNFDDIEHSSFVIIQLELPVYNTPVLNGHFTTIS
jgi:hypothetical protein